MRRRIRHLLAGLTGPVHRPHGTGSAGWPKGSIPGADGEPATAGPQPRSGSGAAPGSGVPAVGSGVPGSSARNTAPPPSAFRTPMRPPCRSTIQRAIARPRPVPPDGAPGGRGRTGRRRAPGPPGRTPGPWSATSTDADAALGPDPHRDRAAARAVPDRVVDEDRHQLPEPGRVARRASRAPGPARAARRAPRPAGRARTRRPSATSPEVERDAARAPRRPESERASSSRSSTSSERCDDLGVDVRRAPPRRRSPPIGASRCRSQVLHGRSGSR